MDSSEWLFSPSGDTPEKNYEFSQSANVTPTKNCESDWFFIPSGLTPEKNRRLSLSKESLIIAKKTGRKRLVDKFPEIVAKATTFMKEGGYEAAKSRGTHIGYCGATVEDIRDHLTNNIVGLRNHGISKTTVRRLFNPPRKSNTAARRYLSLIPAKVPPKRNNRRRPDPDAQYFSSRVRLLRELVTHFSSECHVVSCDNKNKINIGVVATSRHIKIRKLFWEADAPNYADHDFPLGYKITPMGYMELPHSESQELNNDSIGREHYSLPQSGPLHIVNRAQDFQASTIEPHVNDLIGLLGSDKENCKPVILLIVDNGPDWSPTSVLNCLYFVRLWKELRLDALFVTSYCPKYSAFNPIEHSWSVCTNALTSLILPATIDGEELPPCRQNISEEERHSKEITMYNAAMEILCAHWNRAKWGGVNIDSSFQDCLSECHPFNDHKDLKEKMKKLATIFGDSALLEELKFMMAHIDRRLDFVSVKKCGSEDCGYCIENPIRATGTMDFLIKHPKFPAPIPDPKYPGHYFSFFDILNDQGEVPEEADAHMQRYQKMKNALGGTALCSVCKSYCFTSKSDRNKHNRIIHQRKIVRRRTNRKKG